MRHYNIVLKREIQKALEKKAIELDCDIEELDAELIEEIKENISGEVAYDFEINTGEEY